MKTNDSKSVQKPRCCCRSFPNSVHTNPNSNHTNPMMKIGQCKPQMYNHQCPAIGGSADPCFRPWLFGRSVTVKRYSKQKQRVPLLIHTCQEGCQKGCHMEPKCYQTETKMNPTMVPQRNVNGSEKKTTRGGPNT